MAGPVAPQLTEREPLTSEARAGVVLQANEELTTSAALVEVQEIVKLELVWTDDGPVMSTLGPWPWPLLVIFTVQVVLWPWEVRVTVFEPTAA